MVRLLAALTALVALFALAVPAEARTRASAAGAAVSTASGSWGLTGALIASPPVAGQVLTASWSLLDSSPRYARVVNTGTLPLLTATYTITKNDLAILATVRIDACVGATWNTSTGTCAGTVVLLDDTLTAGGTRATAPAAAGAALSIRFAVSGLVALSATLSISTARVDVRAATTTRS